MTRTELYYYLSQLKISEKLIIINAVIFVFDELSVLLLGHSFSSWFHLPKPLMDFFTQPWSLVTYSFFHASLGHIFWNMFMLYFSGAIFLNFFNPQRFLKVYFLGVVVGGLVFLLSYTIFPTLLKANTALVGASAGVTAILIFVCTYVPKLEVRVIFFTLKLWHVGAFFVLADLIQIVEGSNVGGQLAHLGGALLGYIYASQFLKRKSITEQLFNPKKIFQRPSFTKKKHPSLKIVYGEKKLHKTSRNYDKEEQQHKIDAILDKISKSGYESLSGDEREFLFKIGKEE